MAMPQFDRFVIIGSGMAAWVPLTDKRGRLFLASPKKQTAGLSDLM
jgi:hypothetical protein